MEGKRRAVGWRSNLLSTLISELTIKEENLEGSGGDGECGGGGGE